MDLTKEQKEIFSKIADIKQVILKNHFDISDLTEQLISTLPFKEGDIVLYLPKGSIKKLIGRELSWNDEPVELKED